MLNKRNKWQQKKWVPQARFIFLTLLYCEEGDESDIARKMGCQGGSGWKALSLAVIRLKTEIDALQKDREAIQRLLQICEAKSGGRVMKNYKPTLKYGQEYIAESHQDLDAYQGANVPVRVLSWFNDFTGVLKPLRVITLGGDSWTIYVDNQAHAVHLVGLQHHGYRFLTYDETLGLKKRHPLCDTCIHNLSCCNRAASLWANLSAGFTRCHEPADKEGIAPELMTLPHYNCQ